MHMPSVIDWASIKVATRDELLAVLPKGGIVAEIGVFKGGFSERIYKIVQPDRLHLIDPWTHQDLPLWQKKNDKDHGQFMRIVQDRFLDQIRARRVILHQGYSLDLLPLFPDGYFDWVYLDGDHMYETVMRELAIADRKVRIGGRILGHDYIKPELYPSEDRHRLGVVPAVRYFCSCSSWKLVFQTPDQPRGSKRCPTFVLERDPPNNRR